MTEAVDPKNLDILSDVIRSLGIEWKAKDFSQHNIFEYIHHIISENKVPGPKREFPTDLEIQKHHDVIEGDQVSLYNIDGSVYGSTTQNDDNTTFYIQDNKGRDVIEHIGEEQFIKLLKKHYNISVRKVL